VPHGDADREAVSLLEQPGAAVRLDQNGWWMPGADRFQLFGPGIEFEDA
jgi:hypothetical protein